MSYKTCFININTSYLTCIYYLINIDIESSFKTKLSIKNKYN